MMKMMMNRADRLVAENLRWNEENSLGIFNIFFLFFILKRLFTPVAQIVLVNKCWDHHAKMQQKISFRKYSNRLKRVAPKSSKTQAVDQAAVQGKLNVFLFILPINWLK